MARQRLGPKKVQRLAAETGLELAAVLVRGNTDHRRDLCLQDGSVVHLFKDGTMEPSELKHSMGRPQERSGAAPIA